MKRVKAAKLPKVLRSFRRLMVDMMERSVASTPKLSGICKMNLKDRLLTFYQSDDAYSTNTVQLLVSYILSKQVETYKEPVMRIKVTPTLCLHGRRSGHNNQMGISKIKKSVATFRPAPTRKASAILTHLPGVESSQYLLMGWQR